MCVCARTVAGNACALYSTLSYLSQMGKTGETVHGIGQIYYPASLVGGPPRPACTDKKERNFGRGRMQSHIRLTTNSSMTKYLRRFFLSYDFAPDPFRNSLYMRKIFPNFFYECAGASVCCFFSVKVRPVWSFFQTSVQIRLFQR